MYGQFRKITQYVTNTNFIVRYVIFSLLGAFSGTTYIAVVSEFASYYYAWTNGLRIPVEGIPYLKLTISTISFIAILAGSAMFAVAYLFSSMLLWALGLSFQREKYKNLRSPLFGIFNKLSELPIGYVIFTGFIIFALLSGGTYLKEGDIDIFMLMRGALVSFFIPFIIWDKRTLVVFACIVSVGAAVAVPNELFKKDVYEDILRNLKYGGGLPVVIDTMYDPQSMNYKLLLRTSEALMVETSEGKKLEIPVGKMNNISYLD